MIAVVKIAGQQYKVQNGQNIFVAHLDKEVGATIDVDTLLVSADDGKLSVGSNVNAKVTATVVEHLKGDKVIAYKQKRRKGFHKKLGHRTHYTKLAIN